MADGDLSPEAVELDTLLGMAADEIRQARAELAAARDDVLRVRGELRRAVGLLPEEQRAQFRGDVAAPDPAETLNRLRSVACNAVAPAVEGWAARGRTTTFLPLSLRLAIADGVLAALQDGHALRDL